MKNLLIVFLFMWFVNLGFSQDRGWEFHGVILDDIVVTNINRNYLANVLEDDIANSIRELEIKAAQHDVSNSYKFDGRDEAFKVWHVGSEGYIGAYYDKEGVILSTVEKYKNVRLPKHIRNAVSVEFPDWLVDQSHYTVYYDRGKSSDKTYKVLLRKGNNTRKLKLDSEGLMKY